MSGYLASELLGKDMFARLMACSLFTAAALSTVNFFPLWAQQREALTTEIAARAGELGALRTEIERLTSEIAAAEEHERTTLQLLDATDHEISLTTRLVSRLQEEVAARRVAIDTAVARLDRANNRLDELRRRYAKRVVHAYKQADFHDLELLVTAGSLNQAFYRYRYLRAVNTYDQRLAAAIKELIAHIATEKEALRREVAEREEFIRENEAARARLGISRERHERLLGRIGRDKRQLQRARKDRREAAAQVENLIADLEARRKRLEEEARRRRIPLAEIALDARFADYRGKLLWPAEGGVISHFGKQRHPTLKTITENTGIDIRAEEGSSVKAVLDGIVSALTWIRGFGNTIILSHGLGYYTVYTHVGDVLVTKGERVLGGQIIATVGSTGSLEGPKLHFEVWENRTKHDPEQWLKKPPLP